MIRNATDFEINYVRNNLDSSAINVKVDSESFVWENLNVQAKFSSQYTKSLSMMFHEQLVALGWVNIEQYINFQ